MPLSLVGRARLVALAVTSFAVASVAVVACVGDDPTTPSTPDDGDGGPGSSSGSSGTSGSSGSSGSSGGEGGSCTAPTCSDPSTLKRCDGTTEVCSFGCATGDAGIAHCQSVYPTGLVKPTDVTLKGTLAITIAADTTFTSETGEIGSLRGANADAPTQEVKDGIGYRLADDGAGHKLGIWTFDSVTIPEGITVRFSAANPVALVAAKTVTINGLVDLRGYANGAVCGDNLTPGPGGFAGGPTSGTRVGAGPGGGLAAAQGAFGGGGGGGGYAAAGGAGGASFANVLGGNGGVAYGNATLIPLVGGSGGAGNGPGAGGGGGGAIQVVAVETISIGAGSTAGGINAGGCNGGGGGFGSTGGAGGAGGAILLETRTLNLMANGHLAATGGGGASGGGTTAPGPGTFEFGGPGGGQSADYPFGGFGGTGSNSLGNVGGSGEKAKTSSGGGSGGGGAVGRIRINNRVGNFTPVADTLRPVLNETGIQAATVGTLDVH